MKLLSVVLLLGFTGAGVQAQVFETASLKLGRPDGGVRGGCHGIDSVFTPNGTNLANQMAYEPPLGQCVITDARLSHLLSMAFSLTWIQELAGGPDWVRNGGLRFNLEATLASPSNPTEQQLLEALKAFLVERFFVKYHRQPGDLPGFALQVAPGGPRLHESKAATPHASYTPQPPFTLTAQKYTMPMLAALFSIQTIRPTVDETGLAGAYDFELTWDGKEGPSAGIEAQLGLHMVSKRVPVSLLVLESAQRPVLN
jgi:uncharacterized protein (TIGR03435 family)